MTSTTVPETTTEGKEQREETVAGAEEGDEASEESEEQEEGAKARRSQTPETCSAAKLCPSSCSRPGGACAKVLWEGKRAGWAGNCEESERCGEDCGGCPECRACCCVEASGPAEGAARESEDKGAAGSESGPTRGPGEAAVELFLRVQHVDFALLSARPTLLRGLQSRVQDAVALAAGADRHRVEVSLSAGSVVARAVVRPTEPHGAPKLRARLQVAGTAVARGLEERLASLEGLGDVATGVVSVGGVRVRELGHAEPESSSSRARRPAGEAWYAITSRLVLGAFLLCCCGPFCFGFLYRCCSARDGAPVMAAADQGWQRPDAWYKPVMVMDSQPPLPQKGMRPQTPVQSSRASLAGPVHNWSRNASSLAMDHSPQGHQAQHPEDRGTWPTRQCGAEASYAPWIKEASAPSMASLNFASPEVARMKPGELLNLGPGVPAHLQPRVVEPELAAPWELHGPAAPQRWLAPAAAAPRSPGGPCAPLLGGTPPRPATPLSSQLFYPTSPVRLESAGTSAVVARMLFSGGATPTAATGHLQTAEVVQMMLGPQAGIQRMH